MQKQVKLLQKLLRPYCPTEQVDPNGLYFIIQFCLEHNSKTIRGVNILHSRWIDLIMEKCSAQEPWKKKILLVTRYVLFSHNFFGSFLSN